MSGYLYIVLQYSVVVVQLLVLLVLDWTPPTRVTAPVKARMFASDTAETADILPRSNRFNIVTPIMESTFHFTCLNVR